MADAAWSPDDSSFRSPFCLMSDRRPVKSMVPGMKGTTRLTGRSFHGFPARLPVSAMRCRYAGGDLVPG